MTRYTISGFIDDAKQIMAGDGDLATRQAEIADRLKVLSKRDDLMRSGMAMGPADASTENFLVWRESPYIFLGIAQFDEHYVSPVHEHDNYWVIACGYRGHDRWDMYERVDDQSDPGHADLRLFDQFDLPPGETAIMPPPPKSIHSHNNLYSGSTLELIFSMAEPNPPERRIIYDVEEKIARPSPWKPGGLYLGGEYPGPPIQSTRSDSAMSRLGRLARQAWCPICAAAQALRRYEQPRFACT